MNREFTKKLTKVCDFYGNFLYKDNAMGFNIDTALEWLSDNCDKSCYTENRALYNSKGIISFDYRYSFIFKSFYLEFMFVPQLGLYMYDSKKADIGYILLLKCHRGFV